jgi:hypothetical protein
MTINTNWPTVEHAWGPGWNAAGGTVPLDRYVDVTGRAIGSVSTARGRQYETDQVQAGTASAVLSNTDGALDPVNTAGPWAGHIKPYQPFRVRAQYPPTQNLLTQAQATGGDLGGAPLGVINTGGNGIDVFSATDPNNASIAASASAFQGSNVFQCNVPSGTAVSPLGNNRICYTLQTAALPGQAYTMQMRVRNITASTTLQVMPFFEWYDSTLSSASATWLTGSTYTLTGSTSAAWTTITITGTVPANAYGMAHGVMVAAIPSATCSAQVDGWQLEKGSTATTFTVPGITYPIYGGYVERWPSKWVNDGTYGVVSPTAVDGFALLSQRTLRDPLTEEIYRRHPRFLYTLGDPQNSGSFSDSTGNQRPAPIAVSKYGAGTLTSGNSITSASPGGAYIGSAESVVNVNNPNPGTNLISAANYISLSSAGITGPANPSGDWSRMIAFRYTGPTPTSGNNAGIWSCMSNVSGGSQMLIQIADTAKLVLILQGPTGAVAALVPGPTVADGNWHLLVVSYSHAGAAMNVSVDGANATFGSLSPALEPSGMISDCVGGFVDATVGNGTTYNYQGDLSYVAEFPIALTSSDITTIYNAWKNSFSGESTDARYARILGWAGYTGPTDITAGQTRSMGPASVGGQDALSALASVVETEGGVHYVNRSGLITFRGRGTRYNSTVPAYTFGENVSAGEWPYEELELDFDSTHLGNIATVTQASSSQVFTAQDATSQSNYFPRTMSRAVNSTSGLECQDAANYLVSRYKNPLTRVTRMRLHPSAIPALWPVCLSLELNTRVRVMRRPFGAPAIAVDAFVEHIQWDLDDQNEAFVTLECSPVDATPYGLVASFHTALNVQASTGVNTLTLKVGADSTNPLAAQLGVGQQLVLEPGTANAETVTVQAVGTTSAGWTTGTVTLTANLTKTHAANSVVCEPLPSGMTDPTTYDASAKFDSAAFSY